MIVKCPICASENATRDPEKLYEQIQSALTTVRQEARAAALRDALGIAADELLSNEVELIDTDRAYNKAVQDVMAALEAAANSVLKDSEPEGENDATRR